MSIRLAASRLCALASIGGLLFPMSLAQATGNFVTGSGLCVTCAGTSQLTPSPFYRLHNLVSDGFVAADNADPNLINTWGVAFNQFGVVWVANNGSGTSTLYDGTGKPSALIVAVPSPANASGGGSPTGIVYSGSTGFVVSRGGVSGPARFIFATENGTISGWASAADGTHSIIVVDNSATGAVYKGLALSAGGAGNQLYAADFHNNKVDVFDSSFKPVSLAKGAFTDPAIPFGFAPFGIQALNGNIYVSYAMQDSAGHDDVHGPGNGFVDVYDPSGALIRRVAARGPLDSPWGMAIAPEGFGAFSNRLLVGNFGDGLINAYDIATGAFVGHLETSASNPVQINGLWGIAFGNGFSSQPVNTLFFAAGPGDEAHGVYGRIDVIPR